MVLKVHGSNRTGTMNPGKGEIVTMWSAHHIAFTGLEATRAELLADGLVSSATLSGSNTYTSETGIVYSVDASYDRDYWAQTNLDTIIGKLSEFATPVRVTAESETGAGAGAGAGTTGTAIVAATLAAEDASAFVPGLAGIGGGTPWGSAGATTASVLVWGLEVEFNQKGMYNDVPGTVGFTKGDPSLGAAADNYGSSAVNVGLVLDGLIMIITDALADGGDAEGVDDLFSSGTTPGDTQALDSDQEAGGDATRSILIVTKVAPDLQS